MEVKIRRKIMIENALCAAKPLVNQRFSLALRFLAGIPLRFPTQNGWGIRGSLLLLLSDKSFKIIN